MPGTMQLPILGPGIDGKSRSVSAQKRQNIYLEVKPEKDKTNLAAYGTPGLKPFSYLGAYPVRGMWWYQAQNRLYAVANKFLYEVYNDGTYTIRGELLTYQNPVSISDNGQQLIIVDGAYGYIYQPTTLALNYTRNGTTVKVTETDTNRIDGDVVEIKVDKSGLGIIPSGTYTVKNKVLATDLVVGQYYVITSTGTTDFISIGASSNEPGTAFAATAVGLGTGYCSWQNQWKFQTADWGTDSGTLEVINNFRQIKDQYQAAGFPVANTVTFLDGYFIVNKFATKQFYLSAPYDGFSWDALQFASKEAYTDNLEAVTVDNSNLVLFGDISLEYWQDVGNFPFPLLRIAGSPTDVGVVAKWSMCRCNSQLMFLGKMRRGGFSVFAIQNYQPVPVSTPDLDYVFSQYPTIGDAIAFSYRQNGHEFYQINFTEAGESWLYDATTQVWSQMVSGDDTRHYGQFGTQYDYNFIVSDYRNGNLYILDPLTYTDNGDHIIRELITPHFYKGDSFNKLHIYRLRLDMQQGVGTNDGQGKNPNVMLQVSRDGGYTWGNEMWTSPGSQGEFLQRAEWRRLGVSRNYVFKFRISDPIKVVFISAAAYATEAQK